MVALVHSSVLEALLLGTYYVVQLLSMAVVDFSWYEPLIIVAGFLSPFLFTFDFVYI